MSDVNLIAHSLILLSPFSPSVKDTLLLPHVTRHPLFFALIRSLRSSIMWSIAVKSTQQTNKTDSGLCVCARESECFEAPISSLCWQYIIYVAF